MMTKSPSTAILSPYGQKARQIFIYKQKMSSWRFTPEIQKEINEFCSLINNKGDSKSEISEKWLKLSNFNLSKPEIIEDLDELPEVNYDAKNSLEQEDTNELLQALQPYLSFELPDDSLKSIFTTLREKLNDQEFSNVCKVICDWKNQVVVEECFNNLLLPKVSLACKFNIFDVLNNFFLQLQEENESSKCTTSELKKLSENFPDKVSNNILIPLLMNKDKKFKDIELLSSVFPILPDVHKDNLIT